MRYLVIWHSSEQQLWINKGLHRCCYQRFVSLLRLRNLLARQTRELMRKNPCLADLPFASGFHDQVLVFMIFQFAIFSSIYLVKNLQHKREVFQFVFS